MAKVTIMGNTCQITTELTRADVERVQAFAPKALKLIDPEDKSEKFAVGLGAPSCSKYGICFGDENAEGELFVTLENPITDHSDKEREQTELTKYFAVLLNMLNTVEAQVVSIKDQLDTMEAEVKDSVTFVG